MDETQLLFLNGLTDCPEDRELMYVYDIKREKFTGQKNDPKLGEMRLLDFQGNRDFRKAKQVACGLKEGVVNF